MSTSLSAGTRRSVVLAALVAVLPLLWLGVRLLGRAGWFLPALALLVIACPCALAVISTPVTIISAISNAAQRHPDRAGGSTWRRWQSLQAVAFDKTARAYRPASPMIAVRGELPGPAGVLVLCGRSAGVGQRGGTAQRASAGGARSGGRI